MVERGLACEAVVSNGYDITILPSVRALPFEQAGLHDRARITMGCTTQFSFAHHGLASEATLHGLRPIGLASEAALHVYRLTHFRSNRGRSISNRHLPGWPAG